MTQICKYKNTNGLQDILTPSTSVPKQIERESEIGTQSVIPFTQQKGSMKRCRGVNRKHASAESGIWNLAFKHHRQIPNSTLRRSVSDLICPKIVLVLKVYLVFWPLIQKSEPIWWRLWKWNHFLIGTPYSDICHITHTSPKPLLTRFVRN